MLHSPPTVARLALVLAVVAPLAAAEPTERVVILVDNSALPGLQAGLAQYIAHVQAAFPVRLEIQADDWYARKPEEIRAALRAEYSKRVSPPLVGAIFVGPIPYVLRGDPKHAVGPAPLFYEDFDAAWSDPDADGVYAGPVHDPKTNATEIWTAWWVPPAAADDRAAQVVHLKNFLGKLDRYYRGEIAGRDNMIGGFGNVTSVEIIEGWWAAFIDLLQDTPHKIRIYAKYCEDRNQPKPADGKEFTSGEFWEALASQTWQHVHIMSHGRPDGFFWEEYAASVLKPDKPNPNWKWLDIQALGGKGGVIVTTSGCSNGNFHGTTPKPDYENSVGNRLLCYPESPTIAYFGANTPQSTGPFAMYYAELTEALKSGGGSYLGRGYFNMRNHDYCWGLTHYFFRGGDEKILNGDPFARYR